MLTDTINDLLNFDPPGTTEAHDVAVRKRQADDWQRARRSLTAADEHLANGAIEGAVAHALVGILALQMSET
jgi:hypothetical protein